MHPTQEIQVQSLVGEDPLEKEMATRSSVLAWKIPWTQKPGRLQSAELLVNRFSNFGLSIKTILLFHRDFDFNFA